MINLYSLKNTTYHHDSLGLRVNAVFIGSKNDDAYSNVDADIEYMLSKSNTIDWENNIVNYVGAINVIEKMTNDEFDSIVKAGNLKLKEYKKIKVNEETRELDEGVTLSDSKDGFISRAERELNCTSNNFEIEHQNKYDTLNSIIEKVSNHFLEINDSMYYDYNFFLMHGISDGFVCYSNKRIAKISYMKKIFENKIYNTARNLFVSCYMEGYPIIAGVRPAKIYFEERNGCKKIYFTPAAPWYSNGLKQ